jgi:outer membrane murein-binding lipoprotein Lpp
MRNTCWWPFGCCRRLKKVEKEIQEMNAALEALKAQVAAIDERDDQIVALVGELKAQVADLQTQVGALGPEIQAAADKLAESVGKFDGILNPPTPPEPSSAPA